jgi:heme exporter protein CcmD
VSDPWGPWGAATPYILAVYGLTAACVLAAVVLSLRDASRWARRSRALERERERRDRAGGAPGGVENV